MSDSLQPHGPYPVRLLYPWNSPGKNTVVVGVGFLDKGGAVRGARTKGEIS